MIFQDPMMTLNPVLRIDTQMIEAVLAHDDVSEDVGADPLHRGALDGGHPVAGRAALVAYPHQFSVACASAWRLPSRCCTGRS